jgi:hypothetical protein
MQLQRIAILLSLSSLLWTAGCASTDHVSSEYRQLLDQDPGVRSHRTVVFFLIDGMSLETLVPNLNAGQLPQIQKYFIGDQNRIFSAHTVFPSLTYPAISSLLTGKPIDQHGIFGNIIVTDGTRVSLEAPQNYPYLNRQIEGQNIFSRLHAKGFRGVSLAYSFSANSDVHTRTEDFEAAMAMVDGDYKALDQKLIDSLENLLMDSSPKDWPEFIFVHLIGLDLTSHAKGPRSPEASQYLRFLDAQLKNVFAILLKAERSHQREVLAMTSSDHGFDEPVKKYFNIEKVVESEVPNARILNEGRFASLYLPILDSRETKSELAKKVLENPSIDIVAYREGERVTVLSDKIFTRFTYADGCGGSGFGILISSSAGIHQQEQPRCPEQLEDRVNSLYYPYFISNLSYYFRNPEAPDMVIIPKAGVSFLNDYFGQHGGPTPSEVLVPLLIRNAEIAKDRRAPPLWKLLDFL